MPLNYSPLSEAQELEEFLKPYLPLLPKLVNSAFQHYDNCHYNYMDLEDVCQDIHVILRKDNYRAMRLFEHKCKFETWLYRITELLVINHWRELDKEVPLEEEVMSLQNSEPGVEMRLIDESNRRVLFAAVQKLPEEKRRLLELQWEGWNEKEIAEEVGLQHQTIRKQLCNIRKELRKSILGEMHELEH